jgi:hypothetical protein
MNNWKSFDDYVAYIRQQFPKDKRTDMFWIDDLIDTHLNTTKIAINDAERINWGRFAHDGRRALHILKGIYKDVKQQRHKIDYETFTRMCRAKMAICGLMYQAEHW